MVEWVKAQNIEGLKMEVRKVSSFQNPKNPSTDIILTNLSPFYLHLTIHRLSRSQRELPSSSLRLTLSQPDPSSTFYEHHRPHFPSILSEESKSNQIHHIISPPQCDSSSKDETFCCGLNISHIIPYFTYYSTQFYYFKNSLFILLFLHVCSLFLYLKC